jgi:hypothetical protein
MKIIATVAVGLALASTLSTAPAMAQTARTFVSPTGDDAAACSLAAPCRTFAAAYALTNPGGEIAVLGTAGYGPLTISKAISIVNGGGFEAGISVPSGGNGIVINAGVNDVVSLRGLTIEGSGAGSFGVVFNSGSSLTVENCVAQHFIGAALRFIPSTNANLIVANTVLSDNNHGSGFATSGVGLYIRPQGTATVIASIAHLAANHNSTGIYVEGGSGNWIKGTLSDSVVSGNSYFGIYLNAGAPSVMTVAQSTITYTTDPNTAGVATGLIVSAGTMRLTRSVVTGNDVGYTSGGGLLSAGDNTIEDNGSGQAAPPTYAHK